MNSAFTDNINYKILNNPYWHEGVEEISAYDFLNTGNVIISKINLLEKTKRRYEEIADSTNGSNYENVGAFDKFRERKAGFIKWIDKIMAVEKKIERFTALLETWKKLANSQIDLVENIDYSIILKCRFIEQMSYEDIGAKIYVSLATVKRWLRNSINDFGRVNNYKL